MEREFSKAAAKAALEYLKSRQSEMLALTRALVETESPSGDLDGSRAVVQLLAEAARKMLVSTRLKVLRVRITASIYLCVLSPMRRKIPTTS